MDLLAAAVAWENMRVLVLRAGALDPDAPTPSRIIASTSALAAGKVGVIGNVVVHSEYRRRGLGRILTSAALEWLRSRRVDSVLLDATNDGQPLYAQLGFVPVGRSWYARIRLDRIDQSRLRTLGGELPARECGALALQQTSSLDQSGFGGDRIGLLRLMLRQPHNWLLIAGEEGGEPSGYLLYGRLRDQHADLSYGPSLHLGPLVARTPEAAAALLAAVLRSDAPWRAVLGHPAEPEVEIRASLPGVSKEVLAFYRSAGVPLVMDDVLMQLDLAPRNAEGASSAEPYPGHPEDVYAWLAPMCF
jgi:ribosomal protein S18 acetylase RimI-like enzyme